MENKNIEVLASIENEEITVVVEGEKPVLLTTPDGEPVEYGIGSDDEVGCGFDLGMDEAEQGDGVEHE